jgi:hypothetical protein
MYENNTHRQHEQHNNSYVNENGQVVDRHWNIRKIMALTAKQVPQNDQFTIVNGRSVHHTAEGEPYFIGDFSVS